MKLALEWRIKELHIYKDSQIIINQMKNDYQIKDEKLVPYKKLVDALRNYFIVVTFQQISRAENKVVDACNKQFLLTKRLEPIFDF